MSCEQAALKPMPARINKVLDSLTRRQPTVAMLSFDSLGATALADCLGFSDIRLGALAKIGCRGAH